ncbi:hypothetical protein [Pantanalinema sp. GBBB05]
MDGSMADRGCFYSAIDGNCPRSSSMAIALLTSIALFIENNF